MKAKILVVDDSSLARRLMRQTLEELGYVVHEASDGAQALERYVLESPNLVLLDMVMTGMYGLDVLSKLRELDPKALVIVATADIQKSTRDMVRSAGAVALINKPVKKEELVSVVDKALAGEVLWN